MTYDRLARRYRYLITGEAAAIAVFVVAFVRFTPPGGHWSEWVSRTYAFCVLVAILVQGLVWWCYKRHLLAAQQRTIGHTAAYVFLTLKRVNWLLLAAFPVVVAANAAVADDIWNSGGTWWGIVYIAGALLEQVNYYHYQLMYDSRYDWAILRRTGRLRRGSIARALSKASRTP